MPTFFDPANLTGEQRERYATALTEYARVQESNLARARTRGGGPHVLRDIEFMANHHRPGPKSALFARLLAGKPALADPPPTSFSYPWYEVIEDGRAHEVMLGGSLPLGSFAGRVRPSRGADAIVLNQCLWSVLDRNAAAHEFEYSFHGPADHANPQQQAVAQRLGARSEWIVRFGAWDDYRLSLGRVTRFGRRDYVCRPASTLEDGNPQVLRVITDGGALLMAEAERRIRLAARDPDTLDATQRLQLAADWSAPLPEHDSDWDWVEFECDGWVLQRCGEARSAREGVPAVATAA